VFLFEKVVKIQSIKVSKKAKSPSNSLNFLNGDIIIPKN